MFQHIQSSLAVSRSCLLFSFFLFPLSFSWSQPATGTGVITGTVDKAKSVTSVVAVERASGKKFPGKMEGDRFTITGLPLGQPYDCIIDYGPARLEGVNFKVPASEEEEEKPVTAEDKTTLKNLAIKLNKFEDVVDVLTVQGNVEHAVVLLNKRRTQPFYGSKPGEMIFRLELWRFDRYEENWVKSQEDLWVLYYRERLMKADYDRKILTLDPMLGGLEPTSKKPRVDLGAVSLPAAVAGVRLRMEK